MKRKEYFAIIGAILIIISTIITGVINLNIYSKNSNRKNELQGLELKLIKSVDLDQFSQNSFNQIGNIMITGSNLNLKDKKDLNYYYIYSISSNLDARYMAAGFQIDEYDDFLLKITNEAIEGDNEAYEKMIALLGELTTKGDIYRSGLEDKISNLKVKVDEVDLLITKIQYLSVCLQVIGLIFLIFKEFPEKKK